MQGSAENTGELRDPKRCALCLSCRRDFTFFSRATLDLSEQFLMVSDGGFCTVLYRNDGCVVACGAEETKEDNVTFLN